MSKIYPGYVTGSATRMGFKYQNKRCASADSALSMLIFKKTLEQTCTVIVPNPVYYVTFGAGNFHFKINSQKVGL